jgi:hypothetical protein
MEANSSKAEHFTPWNKGQLVGQKLPLKLREIWAIRICLQLSEQLRDLALFNLAIHSKLRGCYLVSLRVRDIAQGKSIFHRAMSCNRRPDNLSSLKSRANSSVERRLDRRAEAHVRPVLAPEQSYWFAPSL